MAQVAGPTNASACPHVGPLQRAPQTLSTAQPTGRPSLRRDQQSSPVKNRMREICTSGTVGGEGGNILAYPAIPVRKPRDVAKVGAAQCCALRHVRFRVKSRVAILLCRYFAFDKKEE